MDSIEQELTSLILEDNETIDQHQTIMNQMREKKFQLLQRREPTRVLVLENLDAAASDMILQLVSKYQEDSSMSSLVLTRYINILQSLIMVFVHRNDAQLCKLLIQRQSIINIDSIIIYFGKELSDDTIKKHQLLPPFPVRQYLISPPLSPPEEWSAPGDGMEQAPTKEASSPSSSSHNFGFNPDTLSEKLVIYQSKADSGFPSITLEFCT
ncbi:modulatory calcineurin-interacting protein [Heterostelium album PN500]|uniref:Modulatory calcineurin-interacting protein n=1 Tax=Heterostelium pallidum (strain ATCC 26659 / Pp 5 / PN500) TaxID=670386 RepID=D3B6M6_HETP5|nr:modulatory calcineurin-interacting protein [Heterostelium album PN500]EFA82996.1 modulatory calcineurin-interacting protein [Heterostelium album PN500]|eukprot:XP_020435113.1 modulatory calcineurin-interacting protein [Heterostelium album PN500]